jgi:hypothetical protein
LRNTAANFPGYVARGSHKYNTKELKMSEVNGTLATDKEMVDFHECGVDATK